MGSKTCILVMAKYDDPTNWIVSAKGNCDELKNLPCYQDPPVAVVPKAGNPATFVAIVSIPNCTGGPTEVGHIYGLQNG